MPARRRRRGDDSGSGGARRSPSFLGTIPSSSSFPSAPSAPSGPSASFPTMISSPRMTTPGVHAKLAPSHLLSSLPRPSPLPPLPYFEFETLPPPRDSHSPRRRAKLRTTPKHQQQHQVSSSTTPQGSIFTMHTMPIAPQRGGEEGSSHLSSPFLESIFDENGVVPLRKNRSRSKRRTTKRKKSKKNRSSDPLVFDRLYDAAEMARRKEQFLREQDQRRRVPSSGLETEFSSESPGPKYLPSVDPVLRRTGSAILSRKSKIQEAHSHWHIQPQPHSRPHVEKSVSGHRQNIPELDLSPLSLRQRRSLEIEEKSDRGGWLFDSQNAPQESPGPIYLPEYPRNRTPSFSFSISARDPDSCPDGAVDPEFFRSVSARAALLSPLPSSREKLRRMGRENILYDTNGLQMGEKIEGHLSPKTDVSQLKESRLSPIPLSSRRRDSPSLSSLHSVDMGETHSGRFSPSIRNYDRVSPSSVQPLPQISPNSSRQVHVSPETHGSSHLNHVSRSASRSGRRSSEISIMSGNSFTSLAQSTSSARSRSPTLPRQPSERHMRTPGPGEYETTRMHSFGYSSPRVSFGSAPRRVRWN